MAYSRWGQGGSAWYIFWAATGARTRDEQRLAIWHAAHFGDDQELRSYAFPVVREMLSTNDFSRIAGYEPWDTAHLREKLSEFVNDVDEEYGECGRGD